MEFQDAFEAIKIGIELLKEAIGITKGVKDLLPAGKEKQAIEEKLEQAEKNSAAAEAQIAMGLGYPICRCSFPPQIMLSVEWQPAFETFQCPRCRDIKVTLNSP